MTTGNDANIERAEALITEAISLLSGCDVPVVVSNYALVAEVRPIEGKKDVVVWYPDDQLAWQTLGLLHSMVAITEVDVVEHYHEFLDGRQDDD